MGNCVNKPREQQTSVPAPTAEEVINSLKAVSEKTNLNEFVHIIKQVLEEKKFDKGSIIESAKVNKDTMTSFTTSGAKFLKFVNSHTEKIKDKQDIFYSGNSTVVAEILGQIGKLHWAAGGLAIAAYLVEKIAKVSANEAEALELLTNMVDLATTLVKLNDAIPEEEEKLKNAVLLVVQGSIMCVSQIYSEKIFSFLKTSINSENLKDMSNRLDHLYKDLTLAITTKTSAVTTEIANRQSILLPVPKPFYPKHAVGIENAQNQVIDLLNMTPQDESRLVVVIYGFGGMGKTTLAISVVSMLNLEDYNYARVNLDEDKSKNDLEKMQKIILKDAFPSFHSGAPIDLRDCQEGRHRLIEAFGCAENRPVFLFIDNVLRLQDLKELLPEDLSDLPKLSRILVTTRKLDATDVFLTSGLTRCSFAMKTLEEGHALEILCKDPANRESIKHDIKRILWICGGVPLALKIVRGHLIKMGYNARKCRHILDALEKGGVVKEENLSARLIDFAYNELEDGMKDAFLDICCFVFNGWIRRDVEYVMGAQEVKSLEEAALVTSFVDDNYDMQGMDSSSQRILISMSGFSRGEERLSVHDIVRARGRSMSASTRFTDEKSFSEATQDETKLNGIKGVWLNGKFVLDVKHLNSMRHSLRILHLGYSTRTSAQSPMKFKELRYLQAWGKIPHLPMKADELDSLGVYVGPIGTNGMSMNKLPERLSKMRLTPRIETFATPKESTSIQGMENHCLEELELEFTEVKDIRLLEGLLQLSSLKILSLWISPLTEFPEQVCQLSYLIKLRIDGWDSLKCLPESFGRLKGLTHLQIKECSELEELPSSFGQLRALEHLALFDCPKIKLLPDGLESLEYLYVKGCEHLSLKFYQSKPDLSIVLEG